jgi:hypothetical protein
VQASELRTKSFPLSSIRVEQVAPPSNDENAYNTTLVAN